MGFSTDCIHAGQEPEPHTGAVTIPIYQTSTYVQPELGRNKGYEYARTKNPTRSALEANLAALERGKHGHCFASGMSAIDVVFRMLRSGDHVVAGENMYGGSYRLFSRVLENFGAALHLRRHLADRRCRARRCVRRPGSCTSRLRPIR